MLGAPANDPLKRVRVRINHSRQHRASTQSNRIRWTLSDLDDLAVITHDRATRLETSVDINQIREPRRHDFLHRQPFTRRRPIARATDPSWPIKIRQLKSESLVQLDDSRRRLIGNHYWSIMSRQQLRRAHLIVPRETAGAVSCELYIIRRIGVDKISRRKRQCRDIKITKLPLPEHARILREIGGVVDRLVRSERHIEIAALVETAEPVEAGAIQIVEQLRRFRRLRAAVVNQSIEARAMTIEKLFVVAHRQRHSQTALHVSVEVNEVRIDVVQERLLRLQSKRDGETAAKRLDVAARCVCFPDGFQVWREPAFAAGPLQRRLKHRVSFGAKVKWCRPLIVAAGGRRSKASGAARAGRAPASRAAWGRRWRAELRRGRRVCGP